MLKVFHLEKTKVSNEINSLENELKKLNNAIIILDKNQKFPLVTNSKLESKTFKSCSKPNYGYGPDSPCNKKIKSS